MISGILKGSPAAEAGLQRGDLIQEIENETIEDMDDFKRIMGKSTSKNQILMVIRHGGYSRYVVLKKEEK